jgi:hypothetical protein
MRHEYEICVWATPRKRQGSEGLRSRLETNAFSMMIRLSLMLVQVKPVPLKLALGSEKEKGIWNEDVLWDLIECRLLGFVTRSDCKISHWCRQMRSGRYPAQLISLFFNFPPAKSIWEQTLVNILWPRIWLWSCRPIPMKARSDLNWKADSSKLWKLHTLSARGGLCRTAAVEAVRRRRRYIRNKFATEFKSSACTDSTVNLIFLIYDSRATERTRSKSTLSDQPSLQNSRLHISMQCVRYYPFVWWFFLLRWLNLKLT